MVALLDINVGNQISVRFSSYLYWAMIRFNKWNAEIIETKQELNICIEMLKTFSINYHTIKTVALKFILKFFV